MPTIKAPLFSDVYQNVDGIELNDKNQILYDGYRDELGFIVKRPGLRSLTNLLGYSPSLAANTPIDGLFWWPQKRYVIAVSGGAILKLTWDGTTIDVTNLTGTILAPGFRPSFATDGTYVFIANGGRIHYTDGTNVTAVISDADAPLNVTHLAFLDSYILANNTDSTKINYSNRSQIGSPTNVLNWSALDFFSAEGNADYVTSMLTFNRELYLFGPVTNETWENDGSTPFSRIPGGMVESGIIAPHSIVQDDNAIYWLDNNKHFVSFEGRSIKRQSAALDKVVQNLGTVSDCRADRVEIDGKPFFIFHFPKEGRCLVLNYQSQSWSEWGHWNSNTGEYERWLGNCQCFCPDWNLHLIGSRRSPIIWDLDPTHLVDDSVASGEGATQTSPIRLAIRTGHIDFGTSKQKRLEELRFRVKRGQVGETLVAGQGGE